ncbi:cytochrome c biogenesis protein ResB [Dysgonomonas sp. GY617]|uniref:cytochrome c biogenesis protein ResB n=1 Tax=Dysgonomonas sp. GY617 TaxID=2780420 RepID=UPI00188482B8|nr:cytochrome c biogenesis protein ResB [Dysgonomonas sp. GY617]MBF0575514.1 cytochrome c biogenesis protein ResB [Dysgonomonas sp. GY617]
MKKRFRDLLKIPQEYKLSILVVLVITLVGLVLNYFVGGIEFSTYKNPINFLIVGLLLVCIVAFSFFRKYRIYKWFTGVPLTVVLLITFLIYGLFIGLIPQIIDADRGLHTFFDFQQVKKSWSFVLLYILLLLSLGTLILRRLISFKKSDYAFYLNHIGIWLILASLAIEATDSKLYMMPVKKGDTEWRVYEKDNTLTELPIAVNIKDIQLQLYENNQSIKDSPNSTKESHAVERIAVNTTVYTKDGGEENAVIEVNKPLLIKNWFIYLDSYDTGSGNSPTYCTMMLIYNPWYIPLYWGIALALTGALCMLGKANSNKRIKL